MEEVDLDVDPETLFEQTMEEVVEVGDESSIIDIFEACIDFRAEDLSEDDGFGGPPRQIQELAGKVLDLLTGYGFVGQKLALQEGQESELLTQSLQELGITVDFQTRGLLLPFLYRATARAVNDLPLSKRSRGSSAPIGWQRAWDAEHEVMQRVEPSGEAQAVSDIPVRGIKGVRKLDPKSDPEAYQVRLKLDEEKFDKLRTCLVEYLTEASAPILAQIELSSEPRRASLGIIGKTRLNTAAKYLRLWSSYREWLQIEKGYAWPRTIADLVDFLFVLQDKPCSPTVPQTWYQTLCWIFRKGGFEGEAYLPSKALLRQNLDKLILDLGQNQQPTLQAARYPISVLAALEIYVADKGRLPFKRIIAASMLFRSWGTLRLDDLQHMRRNTLRLMGDLLITELSCTKTTGPGKRVRQLPVAVAIDAQILPMQWIVEFLDLLQTYLPLDRDFLLDAPTQDFKGSSGQRLSHAQASAISKLVISELRVPILKSQNWELGDEKLVPPELEDLFSQHSGRAVLPSMAVFIEQDKSKRDCLGRWKPSASDDYMRTYRTVVASIQIKTVKAIQSGNTDVIKEHDIVDRAARHLRERKGLEESEVGKICRDWQKKLSDFTIYLRDRWTENSASESAPLQLLANASCAVVKPLSSNPSDNSKSRVKVVRQERYLITYSSNRRISRLHSTEKGCYWAGIAVRDFWLGDVVDETLYNRRCKFCWPTLLRKEFVEEEVSESSDSSGDEDD
jgi:hypothetical protein